RAGRVRHGARRRSPFGERRGAGTGLAGGGEPGGAGSLGPQPRSPGLSADARRASLDGPGAASVRDGHRRRHGADPADSAAVRGDDLTFNLRSHTWALGTGRAALLPPRLLSPLFVNGRAVSEAHGEIDGGPASITTCDLPEPHYHIEGRWISILPEKRAVIR